MKLNIIPAAAIIILLSQGTADAQDWYGSILAGASFDPSLSVGAKRFDTDNGFNVGGRFGTDLDSWGLPNLSANLDLFYDQSHYRNQFAHLGSSSIMGDVLYHFHTDTPLTFYGGLGLGAVATNLHVAGVSYASTVFGWQAIGGIEYPLSPTTSLFTEYRYQNAHDANLAGISDVGNTSNNLSMGIKFKF